MSRVAPKQRKHLCADALFRLVHQSFATIPDHRADDAGIALPDALMSAFAMFSLKSPSLLAFDKQRAEGNLSTVYGIPRAPCDTYRRETLDPVSPESLRPSFTRVLRQLQRGKALADMVFLDGHDCVALDGTGDCASPTIHCASCLHKVPRNGALTSSHQRLSAAISHPDCRAVIPRMPAPIVTPDGTSKNDGARNAAQRFLAKLRQAPPHLTCISTADSLSANAPHIETLHDSGCHSILGVKAGDHAYVFKPVQAAEDAGHVTDYERHDRAAGVIHRLRFVPTLPLHASRADGRVHCLEYGEIGPNQGQHVRG